MTTTTLAADTVQTRADILAVRRRIRQHPPEHPTVKGALDAVEWLLGDRSRVLIEPEGVAYVDRSVVGQAVYASMIAERTLPGDPAWARGTEGVLFWASCNEPLPAWLRVTPDC